MTDCKCLFPGATFASFSRTHPSRQQISSTGQTPYPVATNHRTVLTAAGRRPTSKSSLAPTRSTPSSQRIATGMRRADRPKTASSSIWVATHQVPSTVHPRPLFTTNQQVY
jgi:hypothetical protein